MWNLYDLPHIANDGYNIIMIELIEQHPSHSHFLYTYLF